MNQRVTLVAPLNSEDINQLLSTVNIRLCKVPFGKNVDDRFKADTLPMHFTICAWNIEKRKEVIEYLQKLEYKEFNVLIDKIDIISGAEGSFCLILNVVKNDQLLKLHEQIYENIPASTYFEVQKYNYHITIHISKNYEEILEIKNNLEKSFKPFKLNIKKLKLYSIYPAKEIMEISS